MEMDVFNHSVLFFNECQLQINQINYLHLYNDSNRNHQGIGIGFFGDKVISSIFVHCLGKDDTTHNFDLNLDAIPIYPFPSFVKQKDLYIFDFSQISIDNLYKQSLIYNLIPRVCAVLVFSVPYRSNRDYYLKDFEPLLEILKNETTISLIVLHYNVPPDQCDWEYCKSTERFISNLPHHLSNQLHQHTDHFEVIDIPSLVVQRSSISSPVPSSPVGRVPKKGYLNLSSFVSSTPDTMVCLSPYMTQTVDCVTHVVASLRSNLNARQFISQLHILCSLLNENKPSASSAVQQRVLQLIHIPSSVIQTSFLTLWKHLCPNPAVSLSHTRFGDDYFLRIQERVLLCEQLCLLQLASRTPSLYLDAMTPQSSFTFFRDLYKVLHSTILSILPCTAKKTIKLQSNTHGISCVENRAYFRQEHPEEATLYCVVPLAYHDQHSCVFHVQSKYSFSWFQSNRGEFQWKGEYQSASIRQLDRDECKEMFIAFNRFKAHERLIPISMIQSASSTSRQTVSLVDEEDCSCEHSLLCPFCIFCWRKLHDAPVKHQPFVVNSQDGLYYSQNEAKWVKETILLVRCKKCQHQFDGVDFRPNLYPLRIDGVLSHYIPHFQKSHCCPLCFRFVEPSSRENEFHSNVINTYTKQSITNIQKHDKMVDIVHHMNQAVIPDY